MSADLKALGFRAGGTFGANAINKSVLVVFGAMSCTILPAVATNAGSWRVQGEILRTGAATQFLDASITTINGAGGTGSAFNSHTTPGETLSGAVTFKLQGISTADNDVRQTSLIVETLG